MDKLTKIESLSQEKLQEVWVEILKKISSQEFL